MLSVHQVCRLVTHSSCHLVRYILCVAPFVFDPSLTLLRRALQRENILQAHCSHLYQRLVIAGYSHRAVTLLYVGLALVGVLLALTWVLELPGSDWLMLGIPGLLCFGLWRFVVRVEAIPIQLQGPPSTIDNSA